MIMSANTRQLYNFIQGSDINGVSSYDIWKSLNPNGTEAEFLEYIRSGPQGEKGEPGSSAHLYFLSCSDSVMKKNVDNILFPAFVTFSGFYREGSNPTRHAYFGRFIIQETVDGSVWETKYTSSKDEAYVKYTPSSSNVKNIRCRLYAAGGTTEELDIQSIVVLSDVENIEIGARNILAKSDIRYEITKDSNEVITPLNVVNTFDLQRLVGKKVVLSYYLDTPGQYTNSDDGTEDTSNRFGIYGKLIWSDSTGFYPGTTKQDMPQLVAVGAVKERTSIVYDIIAPDGYDTIEDVIFEVNLTLKPDASNDSVWVFERPKLEIGSVATGWSLAPEDIETLVVTLGNDAHVIATDKDGNSGNYDGCETNVKVYSGLSEVTDQATYVILPSEGVVGEWDASTFTYNVTDMSVDTGYVDIEASYRGISVVKRFSLSKTKAGSAGQSTYDIWKDLGYEGDTSDFIQFLRGRSAYQLWLEQEGNEGKTEEEYFASLIGPQGPQGESGASVYDTWKGLGYEGSAQDFLEFLTGKSAYEYAKDGGYTGSEDDFKTKLATEYTSKNEFITFENNVNTSLSRVAFINDEDNENVIDPDIEATSITIDSILSETSTNPVQNRVITEKIKELENSAGGGSSVHNIICDYQNETITFNGKTIESIEGNCDIVLSDDDFAELVSIVENNNVRFIWLRYGDKYYYSNFVFESGNMFAINDYSIGTSDAYGFGNG